MREIVEYDDGGEASMGQASGHGMTQEQAFFRDIIERNVMRVGVRAIVVVDGHTLVQRPTDDANACYSFIGGGYEVGDTLIGRLRQEFQEETNTQVVDCTYLFMVENRFRFEGSLVHGLEHYFEVTLDRDDIESREPLLAQHWLPVAALGDYDLRPHIVRDLIIQDRLNDVRHLVVPLD